MPDKNGNLILGDAGYVDPQAAAPEVVVEPVVETPVETPVVVEAPQVPATEPSADDKYNLLLAAYNKLKDRSGIDLMYAKVLDHEAGL
jgi:hypothetical protein